MNKPDFFRQLGLYNPAEHGIPRITVAGCGGIGSFVVGYLTQMGMSDITVYDNDKIESHNLPNQNFDLCQVDEYKVMAMRDNVKRRTDIDVRISPTFITQSTKLNADIVIIGTDSIESRKVIYENAVRNGVRWLIDGRLGGEYYQVFTIDLCNKEERKQYSDTLFEPNDAVELPCTEQAIIYIALQITSDIIRTVKNIVMGEDTVGSIEIDRKNKTFVYNDCVFGY